ncbi:MAG: ABC-F family ATP-binding cassette domain-containing protein [Micrococcales bacterium]|nr:ABC-F family ATP-binding cassette domain-containing protein [Micrococcales bacterium]
MSHLLGAESVSVAYPNRRVLEPTSLGVHAGDRIGIVGRNGDGKSTLLNLLAGDLEPDSGRVTHRNNVTVAILPQEDSLDDELTVRAAIVHGIAEHEWAGDARIRGIIQGILGPISLDARCGELSGGQRRRVALASVLTGDHDVLLLDEPTNHLDIEAVTWLAQHLTTRWTQGTGALAVVTHDRWFLDAVCTSMWEIHGGRVEPFDGGYAAYVLQRVERDRQAAAAETRRRNIMRKELAWLRRGAPARTSKPKFRLDIAAQLIANEPPPRDAVELARLSVARLGKDVIDLTNAHFAYDDGPPVVRDVTWSLGPGERIGILGPNGAGKTTLLGLLTGALTPTQGRVKTGKSVRVATLSQDYATLEELKDSTVSDVLTERRREYAKGGHLGWTGGGRDARLPGAAGSETVTPSMLLDRLGFSTGHLRTPIGDLSGGQRRRLQLALVLMDEPNVLVLDEPTNDLDTDMLAAVEDLLDSWPGTLLVVTHDRYLIERVTDTQWAVLDGKLRHLPGGVDEYLALRAGARETAVLGGGPPRADVGEPTKTAGQRAEEGPPSSALSGAELRAARKALASCERKLDKLREELAATHQAMADSDQSDYQRLDKLLRQARRIEAEIATQEEHWLELAAALE